MITSQLLHPASIVVVGASNNVHKPGGAILKNLIHGGYTGELRAVNPKETEVQGLCRCKGYSRYGPCYPCYSRRSLSRCGRVACF